MCIRDRDKEVQAKGTVPRDALVERITSASSVFHTIMRHPSSSSSTSTSSSTSSSSTTKPKPGSPPKVLITLETRGGNKTVTKISGVEAYHISPQLLADELRKTCAGSTSVEQMHGSSPRNPVMEIMVQGPQREEVVRALGRRGAVSYTHLTLPTIYSV